MSIFCFTKKPENPTGAINGPRTGADDFQLRTPFWAHRPTDYKGYPPFENLRPVLDCSLDKLLQGEVDAGNGDILDNCISGMARQAERDLDRQRTEHGDAIIKLSVRNRGDQKAFMRELELLRLELADNNARQAEIKTRLGKNKFSGGKNDA